MMAVDGVAPRAKMNQQRARRFRSAMDAKMNAEKAERAGTVLPKEAAFDSNCITPGTPFMDRLQEQLKYYVNKKISEDSAWRDVTVILSGHDVPGEGEHKIMEYIRNSKAAPGYEPNVRHCLYGLDADLVMLGLLSHEPHFSLLREEVSFGRKPKRATKTASEQNFYLLHLSLIREYLGFEFESLHDKLRFSYDFERVLDDFILMCFFVGNDFLPHLPGIHINEGGLATLFDIYKTILPQCDGYLNDNGKLNVQYCQLFFSKLEELELEEFKNFQGDSSWMQGKKSSAKQTNPKKLTLSKRQEELFEMVKSFLNQPRTETLQLNWSKTPAGDRAFLLELIPSVGLTHSIETGDDYTILDIGWDEDDDESDEESNEARARVVKKYELAERKVVKTKKEEAADKQIAFDDALKTWKKDYYREKLEIASDYDEKVSKIVYSYVEGLQWVLLYYYHGVASWEWFYPYHYGPKISDLKTISSLVFKFHLGAPFFPFEQLMAVLPPLSKQHVPTSLQELMIDIHSPIIDFYPTTFELDMNGKTAEWEAIVKIPFIDEKRLLKAVRGRQNMLSADEKRRNTPGCEFLFMYSHSANASQYPSPLPSFFPDIFACYCLMNVFSTIPKPAGYAINKLNENALLGKFMLPGFPSLYTLPFSSTLGHHGVNVFNSDSKNPSHVLTLENVMDEAPEEVAMRLIGSTVYSDWPFLIESHVLQVSDEYFVYEKRRFKGKDSIVKTPHNDQTITKFSKSAERAEKFYSKRFGVITGVVDMVAKIETLIGMQLLIDGSIVKEFKVVSEFDTPIQLLVLEDHHDPRFHELGRPPIHEEFPYGSGVFFLSPKIYGTLCEVAPGDNEDTDTINLQVTLPCSPQFQKDNRAPSEIAKSELGHLVYYPGWKIAKRFRLSAFTLSRITSNFQITLQGSNQKLNIGLCLKFESKGLKVLGYTRKNENGWDYSQMALDLIEDYRQTFPTILEKIQRGRNTDFFFDSDFFPTNTKDCIEKLQKWLAQKGVKQLLAVPLNSVSLTKETVLKIERNVEEYNEILSTQEFEPILIKAVPRKNILKPAHSAFRLIHQTFELGDRVISTVDYGNVPLAAKGTVIGTEKENIFVCWDYPFMHATNLDGLCSSNRGSSVEKSSVLNLTNIQPPYALDKKLVSPKQRQKTFPSAAPKPATNKWLKGAPQPIQNEKKQMESMLKTMLHISESGSNYNSHQPMYHPPSQAWQPPIMMHGQVMNSSATEFVPLGPNTYDSSWRPPVPISSSINLPPQSYDEMTTQLLSILHSNPQQASQDVRAQIPQNGNQVVNQETPSSNRGKGRGRGSHQGESQRIDQVASADQVQDKPRKQFVLKKRGE